MNITDLEIKLLKALAHPIRLSIIKQLSSKTLCVCELLTDDDSTQSNISQHLRILKDAGIVTVAKDGNKMMYSVKNKKILDIIKLTDEVVVEDLKGILNSINN